jgi:dihydroorotate dehydrogenase electron transfer subunit
VVTGRWDLVGTVRRNGPVSAGLLRLDLALPRAVDFAPGQFAMLNLVGPAEMVLRRPFSILASADGEMSFLYRVAGRGTALIAGAREGERVACLAPLGAGFPAPTPGLPVLLLAGGVGVPPLQAWWTRHRRGGDLAFFGGRDGGDVPWELLAGWRVSIDNGDGVPAGREAFVGLVTDLCAQDLVRAGLRGPYQVMACGPTPMLRAAAALAAQRGWPCLVSVEEHMGCGYGVCKGCVVPVRGTDDAVRNAMSCEEGPVFDAAVLAWDRFQPAPAGAAKEPA